jgi:hypothetical protein
MRRELDTRMTAEGDTVVLVWDDERDRLELQLEDAHGSSVRTAAINADDALDAVRHPYLYLPSAATVA